MTLTKQEWDDLIVAVRDQRIDYQERQKRERTATRYIASTEDRYITMIEQSNDWRERTSAIGDLVITELEQANEMIDAAIEMIVNVYAPWSNANEIRRLLMTEVASKRKDKQ